MNKLTVFKTFISLFGIIISLLGGMVISEVMNNKYKIYPPTSVDTSSNPTEINFTVEVMHQGQIFSVNIKVIIELRNGSIDGPVISNSSNITYLSPGESKNITLTFIMDNQTAYEIWNHVYTVYYKVILNVKIEFYNITLISARMELWNQF